MKPQLIKFRQGPSTLSSSLYLSFPVSDLEQHQATSGSIPRSLLQSAKLYNLLMELLWSMDIRECRRKRWHLSAARALHYPVVTDPSYHPSTRRLLCKCSWRLDVVGGVATHLLGTCFQRVSPRRRKAPLRIFALSLIGRAQIPQLKQASPLVLRSIIVLPRGRFLGGNYLYGIFGLFFSLPGVFLDVQRGGRVSLALCFCRGVSPFGAGHFWEGNICFELSIFFLQGRFPLCFFLKEKQTGREILFVYRIFDGGVERNTCLEVHFFPCDRAFRAFIFPWIREFSLRNVYRGCSNFRRGSFLGEYLFWNFKTKNPVRGIFIEKIILRGWELKKKVRGVQPL